MLNTTRDKVYANLSLKVNSKLGISLIMKRRCENVKTSILPLTMLSRVLSMIFVLFTIAHAL
ncbi:hypothetical protein [Vibrio alfacsensis]|uniref:hypothetical protein n=1 Tax=Vibrio alfacsensis TaxID=1074311 RepID=UPI004068A646